MTEVPSVKRLVMFRHGVAYVERSGAADGDFEMSFKRDEMNDVLKSLSVWVASGDGRVGAVGFEAPDDPREALRDRNLLLEPGQVAQGLLTALCGRSVVIQCGDDEVRGEVIGIEQTPGGESAPRRQLVLRTGDGSVGLVDLATARSLQLSESPSRADLDFLIDRSRAASTGTSRSVSVQLAGRADDLRVAYVIPAPVWRVSYRLAVEADEAVLMAWAIVHNPVDENLDEIELRDRSVRGQACAAHQGRGDQPGSGRSHPIRACTAPKGHAEGWRAAARSRCGGALPRCTAAGRTPADAGVWHG